MTTARERAKARDKRQTAKILKEKRMTELEPMTESGRKLPLAPKNTKIGEKQRMAQFKKMLLNDSNGTRVINKALQIAMDDEHPSQMAAIKLWMDRIVPVSMFEEEKRGDTFTISISTILQEAAGRVIEHGVANNLQGNPHGTRQFTLTHNKNPQDDEEDY